MKDPFNNQQTKKRYLKIGIYGATGVGKTLFALTFPGLAYIDCEGGTTFYNIVPLRTKSFSETINAIKFLKTEKHDYKTVVIDPITVIYEALQSGRLVYKTKNLDKAASGEEYSNFTFKDWGDIKRFYNLLISELLNLPMNVIVIGRMKDEYVMKGKEMIKIGHKFDGEKSTPYHFDIVGELSKRDKDRILRLDKCRPGDWDQGDEIKNPTFKTLQHLIDNVDKNVATIETEEEASSKDAAFFHQQELENQDNSSRSQQQKPPSKQQQNKGKQGTIAGNGDNGNGITPQKLCGMVAKIAGAECVNRWKKYCYKQYGIEHLTELNTDQLRSEYGYLKEANQRPDAFKKFLDNYKEESSADKKSGLIQNIKSKLNEMFQGQRDRIDFCFLGLGSSVALIDDLPTVEENELIEIFNKIDILYNEYLEGKNHFHEDMTPALN